MSLGMWKDSAIDLAALAKSHKEHSIENADSSLPADEGATAVMSLGLSNNSDPDLAVLAKSSSSTEFVREGDSKRPMSESGASPGMPAEEKKAEEYKDGRYSEFNADYSEYGYYDMEYPYAAPTVLGLKQSSDGLFCCLFAPWFGKKEPDKIEESYDEEKTDSVVNGEEEKVDEQALQKRHLPDDDDASIYGEKLTDQDRSAALARLRVSETDPGHVDVPFNVSPTLQTGLEFETASEEKTPEKGDETTKSGAPKVKGILKSTSTMSVKAVVSPKSSDNGPTGRRSLFATTYERLPHEKKQARFSPMARVVTIKSCTDMTYVEKSSIWWQKSDYDSFKKAGRLIAKAMIEGGSEIWLTNSSKSAQIQRPPSDGAKRSFHLSERSELRQEAGDESSSDEFGSKWWCKFGHSRRGLEHIASVEEGRQRQNNVRLSVRAVLDEQRRQKMYGKNDPERIRSVGLKHTSWARDLSLATGAADAESVRSNFSDGAKPRSFYLQKQASASIGSARQVPAFMNPSVPKVQNSLDANTTSQIRLRRIQLTVSPRAEENKSDDVGELEAIHDTPHSSISRRAAGFGTECQDMAAVLSGMGAVSVERETVASR